jgi:ribosomal protein S18 acetylase RimI-like enzyme
VPLGEEAVSARRWCYERGSLWCMNLADGVYPQTVAEPPRRLAEAAGPMAPELAAAMRLPTAGEVEERFHRGSRCFAAWINSDLAAYGWVTPGTECIGELEREIRLGPQEAYIWDCVTLPAYRRRGLYTALLRLIVAGLAHENFRRLWIGSSMSNRPSIRGFAAAGFRPVLRVVYVRVGGFSCLYTRRFRKAPSHLADVARGVLSAPGERKCGPLLLRRMHSSRLEPCPGVGR